MRSAKNVVALLDSNKALGLATMALGLAITAAGCGQDEEERVEQTHNAITVGGACATISEGATQTVACPAGQTITAIDFASYGTSGGSCGAFVKSSCNAASSASVVSSACVGKNSCTLSANNSVFGDPCVGVYKHLSVQATCSGSASASGLVDGSFEKFSVGSGGLVYKPAGTGWTWSNANSGIEANGSAFAAANAPDGKQAAFLQSNPSSGGNGWFSQSVAVTAGTYTLSFKAAKRTTYGGQQSFIVFFDDKNLGRFTPASGDFAAYTTASFSATAGTHTIKFVGDTSNGDNTAFIDLVALGTGSGGGTGGGGTGGGGTGGGGTGGSPSGQFRPGQTWLASDGSVINAHDGGINYYNGRYYWYGSKYTPDGSGTFIGIVTYSSTDLYNWKYEGVALASNPSVSDLSPSKANSRAHVIRNASTGKFVMWLHVDDLTGQTGGSRAGVAVSDSPTGPFQYRGSFQPIPNQTYRDDTIFLDDDGKAYAFYASEDNWTMYVVRLSADYLDIQRPAVENSTWARILIGANREAPAPFKFEGKYYLVTSGCTGWSPNPADYAIATSPLGPYQSKGNPTSSGTTYGSQSTAVFPIPGKPGSFIFLADQWNPGNLADSRYVWLPFKIASGSTTVQIPWRDQWDLSVFN